MEGKTEEEYFLEHMPALSIWYKALLTYLSQFFLFILAIIFFWQISINLVYGAIIGQFIIAFSGTLPYIFMAKNSSKIRKKYREKYGKLAFQQFWYRYHLLIIPLQSVSLYLPVLLKTDYFLPVIIHLPNHFITKTLLPIYIAIPLGLFIVIMGFLIIRPSVSYSMNVVGNRFHLIYPENSKLIINGMYRYIRNPQYLGRGIISIGLGVFANNILAVIVGLIHFLSFCIILPAEDNELISRFGEDFIKYKKDVPNIIPRFRDWKKFVVYILVKEKKKEN